MAGCRMQDGGARRLEQSRSRAQMRAELAVGVEETPER